MNTTFAKDTVLEQLEADVRGELRGRVRELQLIIWRDGVVLRGFAQTYYAKQLAQHAVMANTHLPIVANEIEVH
jgi:hypothetical protein